MIRERLTAPRKAVSLFDHALLDIEDGKLREYARTRDLEVLGDLSKLPEQPTIFVLEPMLPKFQHLEFEPGKLLQYHLHSVENGIITAEHFEEIPGDHLGRKRLSQAGLKKLPHYVVVELGNLVWELASKDGVITPFTFQASLLVEERIGQKQLSAIHAHMALTAQKSHSK
jgi:hypothetical protein